MEFYGCKLDTPKCFLPDKKPVVTETPKSEKKSHKRTETSDRIIALDVLRKVRNILWAEVSQTIQVGAIRLSNM